MYAIGRGVPQDDAEAVRWYRLAADQGYVPALINLGNMYETGEASRRTTCRPTCGTTSRPHNCAVRCYSALSNIDTELEA